MEKTRIVGVIFLFLGIETVCGVVSKLISQEYYIPSEINFAGFQSDLIIVSASFENI